MLEVLSPAALKWEVSEVQVVPAHILHSAVLELLVKVLRAGLIQVEQVALHRVVAAQVLKVLISLPLPQSAQLVVRVWLPVIRAVLLLTLVVEVVEGMVLALVALVALVVVVLVGTPPPAKMGSLPPKIQVGVVEALVQLLHKMAAQVGLVS